MLSLFGKGNGKFESGAILCKISKLERLLMDFAGEDGDNKVDEVDSRLDGDNVDEDRCRDAP
jgi:hypothetical protein